MALTPRDIFHATATWQALVNPTPCGASSCPLLTGNPDGCDCNDSEVILTSIGYVEVYRDGDVIAHGRTLANVGD